MFQGDYFALELVEGLLYVHISMDGDAVKFRASRASHLLSDGQWHKVTVTLPPPDKTFWTFSLLSTKIFCSDLNWGQFSRIYLVCLGAGLSRKCKNVFK